MGPCHANDGASVCYSSKDSFRQGTRVRFFHSPFDHCLLQYPEDRSLYFVVVTPAFEAPTREMRAVLPKEVSEVVFEFAQNLSLISSAARDGTSEKADLGTEPTDAFDPEFPFEKGACGLFIGLHH